MIPALGGALLVLVALALVWWDVHGERWRRAHAYRTRLACAACRQLLNRGSDRKFYETGRDGRSVLLCETCQRTWTRP